MEHIWNEIGETETDKDRMLLELERECLEVYRKKVDEASNSRVRLYQSVAAKEAELAALMAALGELSLHSQNLQIQTEKGSTSLKEQLASLTPLVENLRTEKEVRIKQFADIKAQIEKISEEISGYNHLNDAEIGSLNVEEQDLSLRKLTEYKTHLGSLQKEKSDRLHKVLDYVNEVHSLCCVLGLDFGETVSEVHPSLHETSLERSANISNKTLEGLDQAVLKLKTERKARIEKVVQVSPSYELVCSVMYVNPCSKLQLKDIVASLLELWNLMDSPEEERSSFGRVTSILGSPEPKITESGGLSLEIIEQAAAEVVRLTKLKASRMEELVMKKRSELEETCRRAHIEPDTSTTIEKFNALMDSGLICPSELLANIEALIIKAKDEALSRKEIIDRISKWLAACEEESWLDDYNQDDNRYSSGRGAHINLKRAEQARVTVNKIPAIVDNLIRKTQAWEEERRMFFLYDGVRLVSILEDYKITRQQKEEEKKRYRDQKKLQDLLLREKEAMYGSKPSPRRSSSFKKPNGYHGNGNGSMTPTPRRLSVGSATPELLTPRSQSGRQKGHFKEMRRLSTVPLNFVAISKEDTMPYASVYGSEPGSPPLG
ncbi:hypothetical protein HHK36_024182 [Tetracentron sinense]|uniref:Uncharacterized protein n=1 Tax=Tetracentron sinense TaxID=13715 RepID=A0A834YNB7_TETSI|nr:hypothetical protein HHK36_024182 [Tetracentron sinense]